MVGRSFLRDSVYCTKPNLVESTSNSSRSEILEPRRCFWVKKARNRGLGFESQRGRDVSPGPLVEDALHGPNRKRRQPAQFFCHVLRLCHQAFIGRHPPRDTEFQERLRLIHSAYRSVRLPGVSECRANNFIVFWRVHIPSRRRWRCGSASLPAMAQGCGSGCNRVMICGILSND